MLANFVVIYRSHKSPWNLGATQVDKWVFWSTCIRQLAFGYEHNIEHFPLAQGDQVYRGSEALRFLLQVVSGLHSPLIGETEVFGQFKQWVDRELFEPVIGGLFIKQVLLAIIRDVKLVRQKHLRDLGSQSYGSLARRKLRDYEEVHLVGSGALTKDMLPWLLKSSSRVVVHARSPEKVAHWVTEFPGVEIRSLTSGARAEGALVIAAPLTAQEIVSWQQQHQGEFDHVLDLRGESVEDPLVDGFAPQIESLPEIFASIEDTKRKLKGRVEKAFTMIDSLVKAEEVSLKIRPFGWDDLCA